jgi:hypothetical protein
MTDAPNFVITDRCDGRRAKQKRSLARLLIARSDLGSAQSALATILHEVPKGPRDTRLFPLHSAAIICYARPFGSNRETGALPKTYSQFSSDEARLAHKEATDLRDQYVAHSDFSARTPRIIPPGWIIGIDANGKELRDVGITGDVQSAIFGRPTYIRLHDNCVELLDRLHVDIDALLEQLYGGMDLPARPFNLRIDDGL